MAITGLAGCPSAHLCSRKPRCCDAQVYTFCSITKSRDLLFHKGSYSVRYAKGIVLRRRGSIRCAMGSSLGNPMDDSSAVFPRINVGDPYKRLGISREASEEEILSARSFLIQRYGGHQPSVDAIESAHDKIIMQKFHERKRPNLNVQKKIRNVTQSHYVQSVLNRFKTPSTKIIAVTSVAFLALGVLTVLYPTQEGPTLQVAISLVATVYFIHNRLRSKTRAFLYGIGAFAFAWFFGTLLMASVVPPLLKGPRSLEVMTSLITYLPLWVSSTYLK